MSEVLSWPQSKAKQAILNSVEKLFDEASQGNLAQIAFVTTCVDGSVMQYVASDGDLYMLLGCITAVQMQVSDALNSEYVEKKPN